MKKIRNIKVENMESSRGNKIANQFIITVDNAIYFQSYNSIIVCKKNGITYLDRNYWDYSVTTGKYRNMFLGETKKETETKLKTKEYILKNLN